MIVIGAAIKVVICGWLRMSLVDGDGYITLGEKFFIDLNLRCCWFGFVCRATCRMKNSKKYSIWTKIHSISSRDGSKTSTKSSSTCSELPAYTTSAECAAPVAHVNNMKWFWNNNGSLPNVRATDNSVLFPFLVVIWCFEVRNFGHPDAFAYLSA